MAAGSGACTERSETSALRPDVRSTYRKPIPAGASFDLRVLPDGYADLLWGPAGNLRVAGPDTRARTVTLAPGTLVAVRFRIGRAGQLLGVPVSELANARVPLVDLWGPLGLRLVSRLEEAEADDARALAAMRGALLARIPDAAPPDPLVDAAVAWLRRSPRPRVAELSRVLGLSDRQLRRRFVAAVGYGPRTFHRISRLQRFLALARPHPGTPLAELASRAGFTDQAHLTNECVDLTGQTPVALLRPALAKAGRAR